MAGRGGIDQTKAAAAATVSGGVASKSLKIDGVLCSGMDKPSCRVEALEDGQRLESAVWVTGSQASRLTGATTWAELWAGGEMRNQEEMLVFLRSDALGKKKKKKAATSVATQGRDGRRRDED